MVNTDSSTFKASMPFLQNLKEKVRNLGRNNAFSKYRVDDDVQKLFLALSEGNLRLARILIEGYVDVNCKDYSGSTPLITVCKLYDRSTELSVVNFVKFLLDRRVIIGEKDVFGRTAVDYAKKNGLNLIRQLLYAALEVDFLEYALTIF